MAWALATLIKPISNSPQITPRNEGHGSTDRPPLGSLKLRRTLPQVRHDGLRDVARTNISVSGRQICIA